MKKRWKKLAALAVTTVMASTIAIGFTACDDSEKEGTGGALKQGTYRTFTSTMPSNWNELTYEDNNDTQILDFVTSSLFTFDYDFGGQKFNEDGTVNASAIVDGGYTVLSGVTLPSRKLRAVMLIRLLCVRILNGTTVRRSMRAISFIL